KSTLFWLFVRSYTVLAVCPITQSGLVQILHSGLVVAVGYTVGHLVYFELHKGETIHNYYVWFAKLINDMWNIKMTMSRMQLNSKFVNNMFPEWGRFVTVVKLNRGLRDSNYDQLYAYLKQHEARLGNNARGAGAAGYGGAQNIVGNTNPGQAGQIKCYNCNGGQDNVVDEDVDEPPGQDLALNVDNFFQADDYNAFDFDDEAPTAQTMFMANLSSAYLVYDEDSPSYNLDILSEVPDHENYQDAICEHHEVHKMHDSIQPHYVVDSHTDYANDSNMILYDQYVRDKAVSIVQSNVSFVSNDSYMMIINEMHEPSALSVYVNRQYNVVDISLTAELATYKEQVKLYKRHAKFVEQKIDEELRIVIIDRNIKKENLKMELYSVKMQLSSTINHNKSMVEEVTSLKKDFKQKENKYLEEFLDLKALKEKAEDKYTNKTSIFKQFTCCANNSLIMMNRTR
nr:hypothetical protein [Tanacetum cinerariifolium]